MKVKRWLLLLILLVDSACTTTYVYKDRSMTGDYSVGKRVSSFLVAHELPERDTTIQDFDPSHTDGSRGLFVIPAIESSVHKKVAISDDVTTQSLKKAKVLWSIRDSLPENDVRLQTITEGEQNCLNNHDQPWDQAYQQFLCDPSNRKSSGTLTLNTQRSKKLVVVEPAFGYYDERYIRYLTAQMNLQSGDPRSTAPSNPKTSVLEGPSSDWPSGSTISWHLNPEYSQLRDAQKHLRDQMGDRESFIKVAHLDSGFFEADTLKPKHLKQEESRTCLPRYSDEGREIVACRPDSDKVPKRDWVKREDETHGSRVISVLAGNEIINLEPNKHSDSKTYVGAIGAFPRLHVAEYRITRELPVHFFPTEMATAIVHATDTGFDVISLSQGGFPSLALRDAVNHAYENGTAIVAATGDYYVIPLLLGLRVTPSTIAFPARFNRVLGVAGVTEHNTSYGDSPCLLFCTWRWSIFPPWKMKGSYGPASEMAGHTLSAYVPNITTSLSNNTNQNAIQLSGEGVSYAVPQVAAAAAMWLELHGKKEGYSHRTWRRTEAVYQALLLSTQKPDTSEYSCEKLGEGILKAQRALATVPKPAGLIKREEDTIGFRWVEQLVNSWDLLKIPLEFVVNDGEPLVTLTTSLQMMLLTEIQQVLHRSDKGSELLAKMGIIENASTCPTYKKPNVLTDIALFLLSQNNISKFLRSIIVQELQNQEKGS